MIIDLNEKYRLNTIDSRNIALQEAGTNMKTGLPIWRNRSYYRTLSDGLSDCLHDAVFIEKIETKKELSDWLEKIRKIAQEIKELNLTR